MGKMRLVTVTPELATKWLNGHVNFRSLNEGTVQTYINEVQAGNWAENGETVKFDEKGHLVDGHHRMEAVIRTGKSIETWVFEGVRKAILRTVDSGRRRKLGDLLKFNGEKNATLLAAVIMLLHRHLLGELRERPRRGALTGHRGEALLAKYPGTRFSVDAVKDGHRARLISESILAFVHFMASRHDDKEMANLWLQEVLTGANIGPKDPTFQLRKWALNQRQRSPHGVQQSPIAALAVATKSWFFFRDGEKVSTLYWRSTDGEFPSFPGYGSEAPKAEQETVEAK